MAAVIGLPEGITTPTSLLPCFDGAPSPRGAMSRAWLLRDLTYMYTRTPKADATTHPKSTHSAVSSRVDEVCVGGAGIGGDLPAGALTDSTAVVAVMPSLCKSVKNVADCITAVAFVAGPSIVKVTPPPVASLT